MIDTMYNGLIQEYLPGNIINANYQGFTTRFDGNTPATTVARSTAAFYQQNRRQSVPDVIEVIPGETGQQDKSKSQYDLDFERLLDFYRGASPEEMERVAIEAGKLEKIPQSKFCESFSDDNYFGIPFKSFCNTTAETTKRFGVFVVGLLLLIIGLKFFVSK